MSNTSTATTTTVLNDSPNSVESTTAGRTYRATAWMRASQPNTSLVLRLLEFDSGNVLRSGRQSHYWATDTLWHKVTVDVVATRSKGTLDLNAFAWGLAPGASFLVDDVSVVPAATAVVPPPPAPAPPAPAPPAPAPPAPAPPAPAPSPTDGVLPAQGTGALFGYYQQGGADPRPMERTIGRQFDLVHHFKDFDATNNMWPSSTMLAQAAEGRTIHVGWELVSYDGGYDPALQPPPGASSTDRSGAPQKTWTYRQVTNGSLDRYLDAVAAKAKATPYTYIVDIDPEMDDRPDIGGTATIRAAAGTRAEFAAAYRYIVDRFAARGVTNVVWAWTVSGWTASDPSKAWSLEQLYPGPGYVDVIMWDPYNHKADRWRSFGELVAPFYNSIRGGLLDRVDPNAKRLPLGLGEYGCVDDPRREAWLRAIPSEARKYPGIVSLGYFSSGSWGALHTDAADTAAFGAAGRDPWFRTRD